VSLGLYPGTTEADARRWVDEIADLGANQVALVVSWEQQDVRATEIRPGGADTLLLAAAAHARRRGLQVTVFPLLAVRSLAAGEWRGTLRPRDPAAWWRAYERFIVHHAELAARAGAAALVIGSELGSTEGWRERWYHLAGLVEARFRGLLVYSANWDHYDQVSFAARIDVLGISSYFPLADLPRARTELLRFARARGTRIWLTEVGYPSRAGAAARPWDYTTPAARDDAEQRRCYETFVKTWAGTPELEGVFIWNWYPDGERGYTPRGKPAEQTLRQWYLRSTGHGTPDTGRADLLGR
jgi:hypothetical protein